MRRKGLPTMASSSDTRLKLGFAALFSVAVGVIVAQSTMVSLLQAVGIGGWGFVGALAIGWLLMACNSATFAELALMMPRAGGLSAYCQAGLGHFPAIVAVFAGYVVPALFGPAAELLLVDAVVGELVLTTLSTASQSPRLLEQAPLQRALSQSLCDVLLATLATPASGPVDITATTRQRVVREARRYMAEHAEEPITVPELCEAIHVSRRTPFRRSARR